MTTPPTTQQEFARVVKQETPESWKVVFKDCPGIPDMDYREEKVALMIAERFNTAVATLLAEERSEIYELFIFLSGLTGYKVDASNWRQELRDLKHLLDAARASQREEDAKKMEVLSAQCDVVLYREMGDGGHLDLMHICRKLKAMINEKAAAIRGQK